MLRRARDNPFATAHVLNVRYRLRGQTWDELLDDLERMNYRAAIVGPEGSGKTTLLEDLQPFLEALGFQVTWLRLTRDQPRFALGALARLTATLTARHIILLDGAEQLGWWRWWLFRWMARRAGGLIITSHRPGLLPTLLNCRTSEELLADILSTLLHDPVEVLRPQAALLHRKHRGNIRDALREMYDTWAEEGLEPSAIAGARVTSTH
jgi:hypothetical protein